MQRKRVHRFTGEIMKRPRFRGYVDENINMFEIHVGFSSASSANSLVLVDFLELCHCFQLTDLRSLRKVMWMLTNEEKFDQLMGIDKDGNGYRDFCMLTADTTIKSLVFARRFGSVFKFFWIESFNRLFRWLNRSEIGLGTLAEDFERHSIFTLGDLSRIYRHDVSQNRCVYFCICFFF